MDNSSYGMGEELTLFYEKNICSYRLFNSVAIFRVISQCTLCKYLRLSIKGHCRYKSVYIVGYRARANSL